MEESKIDKSKLRKISSYAKMVNQSVQWIYKLVEKGELIMVEIDGVKFIKL